MCFTGVTGKILKAWELLELWELFHFVLGLQDTAIP